MTGMEGGKVVGIKLTSKGDLAREIKRVVGEKKDYDLDELKKLGKAARENLGSGKLARGLNKVIKTAEEAQWRLVAQIGQTLNADVDSGHSIRPGSIRDLGVPIRVSCCL